MSRLASVLLITSALALGAVAAGAQERGDLRFEKTVDFQLDRLVELGALVGPVKVRSIELTRGGSGGGVMGRLRGGSASETQTGLTAAFDTENPSEDEWVVTYTLEFLDSKGKLIDRVSGKEGFEGEADVYRLNHSILEYVVPMIDKVKVRLEARYD